MYTVLVDNGRVSPRCYDKIVAHLADPKPPGENVLSQRELEVLSMLIQGAANKKIAYKLNITERTVKALVTHIFNKLGVNSRTEAVVYAVRNNLMPDPD